MPEQTIEINSSNDRLTRADIHKLLDDMERSFSSLYGVPNVLWNKKRKRQYMDDFGRAKKKVKI